MIYDSLRGKIVIKLYERRLFNMRIIIDTKENKIICPKPFWEEVQKKKDILKEMGMEDKAKEFTHHQAVKDYFNKAIANELIRADDIRKK